MEQQPRRRRRNRVWCSKILSRYLKRNRVQPIRCRQDEPGCEYLTVGPRRTLRILRPELNRAGRYYENPPDNRPESLNDNFYLRWTKRPHPSGNCRCSFRQSKRLSTHEEIVISKEIQRIRTSLCEAEKSGRDIEDVEKSLDLSQLHEQLDTTKNVGSRIDRLDEHTRKKIVRDLDRYISDLLDEILNDTIRAIARAENPFGKATPGFDITFSFHKSDDAGPKEESGGGYVNQGFLGSASDPDALDFQLRNDDSVTENVDCTDSGINSVETIELQPPEQDQNLEQSLMEIIDAKLGGSAIGKSLENLGMEIDEVDTKTTKVESPPAAKSSNVTQPPVPDSPSPQPAPVPPVVTNNNNNNNNAKSSHITKSDDKAPAATSVTTKVNRTVTAIRRRIATKLRCRGNKEPEPQPSTRASLKLEDYRRRFLPQHQTDDDVTLRNNGKRKPTIVFLHGFGSSADCFGHQLRYFAELGYPCVAPDLLGHGMSSAPRFAGDYRFDKLLTDLEIVLIRYALKPGHKCVIVAHNYGCSFATALANKYPSNIHQLVLISGGGPTPLAPPLREGAAHCCLRASLAPLLFCGMNRTVLYSARGRQHPYCGEEEGRLPSHMEYVKRGMSWPDGDYVFHRRICTPTLLVHGLRDNKVSLVQECQMERTMVKAFLEAIPAAGHMPMTDCPEQLNHMIRCFIDLWKNKKW